MKTATRTSRAAPKADKTGGNGAGKPEGVNLLVLDTRTVIIKLVGDSGLITDHFANKFELKGSEGGPKLKSKPQTAAQQIHGRTYFLEYDGKKGLPKKGYGLPATAFKKSVVESCTSTGHTKVAARQMFHVVNSEGPNKDLVRIKGKIEKRCDTARNQSAGAVIVHRPWFPEWSVDLEVVYNAAAVTLEQLLYLFNVAGFGVGVGTMRPERNGKYGLFHVAGKGE